MKKFMYFSNLKESIKKLYMNNKKIFFLSISLFAVMVLVFVSSFVKKTGNKSELERKNNSVSVNSYAKSVEDKLSSMLISLDEIKKVSVMIMVDSTPEIKYLTEVEEQTVANNTSGNSTTTKSTTVIFEKNGSISTPVTVTTIMPKVTGILIVTNKISASTKINIINAVSIVLNISSNSISILQES